MYTEDGEQALKGYKNLHLPPLGGLKRENKMLVYD